MDPAATPRLRYHALGWAGVAVTHAVVVIADAARRDVAIAAWELVGTYLLAYLPWVGLSWWLARGLARRPELLGSGRALARFLGATMVAFFIPQVAYQATLTTVLAGRPLSAVPAQLRASPVIFLVLDAVLFVATGAVVAARAVARQRQRDDERRRRLDAENQALRLETTRHQLRVLQSQLEPHFLFNALNAIGATVRTGDRARALEAIQQVAALLRFAVGASKRDRITWGEELSFIRDYLALQGLRFGDRLDVRLSADDPRLADRACLPLILQPLVENAIHHCLARAPGPVTIDVAVRLEAAQVTATVRNPLFDGEEGNPGLGESLGSLRSRLALAYREAARLDTRTERGEYVATLRLPDDDD